MGEKIGFEFWNEVWGRGKTDKLIWKQSLSRDGMLLCAVV